MKPWETIETLTVDGTPLKLARHDDEFLILAGNVPLMSSRAHGSEEALATIGCQRARLHPTPCVLVGGLGMGFTLRAVLDVLPAAATVIVAELLPQVVQWNRGVLAPLAGRPLDDPRVQMVEDDVVAVLRAARARFDAVLLDIDNGPSALTTDRNTVLYADRGIGWTRDALTPDGTLAVWSAFDDRGFARRLESGGFVVETERVRGRSQRGSRHVIFVAQRHASGERG